MKDKVCVVTGGNRGIGYEIVRALAKLEATVMLVSRSQTQGEAALAQLKNEQPQATIHCLTGDFSTVNTTRQFAESLLASVDSIDVFVNNAGIWPTKKEINVDGLEMGFMVNFLAPFMLSHLLKERFISSAPARIVHVNAGLYVKGKVDLQKTPYGADFGRLHTYATTKLCSVLTLAQEAALFAPHGVTVNMVHPGVVNTNLGQMNGVLGWLLKQVKRSWMTPEQGAVAPVWLATSDEVANQTGHYFNEKEVMALHEVAQDEALAKALWRFAKQAAHLEPIY